MFKKLKELWNKVGPGIVTGAADNDPSGIATYSIAGARMGYSQLWILVFVVPLMIAVQEMSARIGALTGCGLAGNIKRHYPRWLLVGATGLLVAANILNIGANVYGMASAVTLLVPLPETLLSVVLSAGIVLLVIKLRYYQIVRIFKWLAGTLLAYVAAFIIIDHNWSQLLRSTFVPHISLDHEHLMITFALLGTTIAPYLFFWQASEEAEDTHQLNPRIRVCRFRPVGQGRLGNLEADTAMGMIFSNVISFFIMALVATTIFSGGPANLTTLREIAETLRPFAGEYAYMLFTLGLVGSGLLAIPVLAGSAAYVVAEFFGWEGSLDKPFSKAREFYVVIIVATALGLVMPFVGISALDALFYTALLNGIVAPILIMLIMHMADNPVIVGTNTTKPLIYWLGCIACLAMLTGTFYIVFSIL